MEKTQREFRPASSSSNQEAAHEGTTDVVSTYRERVAKAEMPEKCTEVNRELDRLERTSEQNPEYADPHLPCWMLDIPWNVRSEDNYDLNERAGSWTRTTPVSLT